MGSAMHGGSTSPVQQVADDDAPLAERLRTTVRGDLRSVRGYAIDDASCSIKLDAMENPYRLPEALQHALTARLGAVALNRYPGSRVREASEALARYARLPAGCSLLVGNGSDDLIALLATICDLPGATILAPVPTFPMYERSARHQGLRFVGVPLTASFELDGDAMLAAIARERPALTYLAYPNNPTGNAFDAAIVDAIVDAVGRQRGFVVFDEAYEPFSPVSAFDRLGRQAHVLVLRTLSKLGLAAARVGYLMGPAPFVAELEKASLPYSVGTLNAEAVLFALEHADELARQAATLRADRDRLAARLQAIPSLRPFHSDANMILVRVPDAARVHLGLRERGVLVKNVAGMHPLLADCLRITVGTPAENARLLELLEELVPVRRG